MSTNIFPSKTRGLLSIPPLAFSGLKHRKRVNQILSELGLGEEWSVQKYIKNHGIKTGIAFGTICDIDRAVGVNEVNPSHRNPALLMVILFTNLDKILDYLPPGDSRFGEIFQYFGDLVLGKKPTSRPEYIDHPKLRELEIFAQSYAIGTTTLIRREEFEVILKDLISAVMEQRNSEPQDMNTIHLDEYDFYKREITQLGISDKTKNALFLATRLGISTFNLSIALGIYNKIGFNPEENRIIAFISIFNGFLQVVDDFLDRERDREGQIFTYATQASSEELVIIEKWIEQKGREISKIIEKDSTLPSILYHGFHLYPLITRFVSGGDQSKKPPYNIDFLRRS